MPPPNKPKYAPGTVKPSDEASGNLRRKQFWNDVDAGYYPLGEEGNRMSQAEREELYRQLSDMAANDELNEFKIRKELPVPPALIQEKMNQARQAPPAPLPAPSYAPASAANASSGFGRIGR